MSILSDPCNPPWDLPIPKPLAYAVPQLAETVHRRIAAIATTNDTNRTRDSATAAIQQAAEANRLSESDVQRLMTVLTTDTADAHQLYLDSLDDPRATDLAGAILGLIQLRQDSPTDDDHVHALTDGDLILLAVVGGPAVAIGVGIALVAEHVHVTID